MSISKKFTYGEHCKYLAQSNDITDGNRLYLRLLYSKCCLEIVSDLFSKKEVSQYCYRFFATVDITLLAIEQDARFKNLKKNLLRSSSLIETFFEPDRFDRYLFDFVNSNLFWNGKGRSLFENFSYFLYNLLDEADVRRQVLKLLGIQSGIGVLGNKPCPWKDVVSQKKHEKIKEVVKCDSFITSFNLFTPLIELRPSKELLTLKKSRKHFRVSIAFFETGEIQFFSDQMQFL